MPRTAVSCSCASSSVRSSRRSSCKRPSRVLAARSRNEAALLPDRPIWRSSAFDAAAIADAGLRSPMNVCRRPKIAAAARVAICWPTMARASELKGSSDHRARQVARSTGSRLSIMRASVGSEARSASTDAWLERPLSVCSLTAPPGLLAPPGLDLLGLYIGPWVVIRIRRFLLGTLSLWNVAEVHAHAPPERRATAHAIDQDVVLSEMARGFRVPRAPSVQSGKCLILGRGLRDHQQRVGRPAATGGADRPVGPTQRCGRT